MRTNQEMLDAGIDMDAEKIARILLSQSPYHAIRRISCDLRGAALIITGSVPTFHQKQVAQNLLARNLKGICAIDNRLFVPKY